MDMDMDIEQKSSVDLGLTPQFITSFFHERGFTSIYITNVADHPISATYYPVHVRNQGNEATLSFRWNHPTVDRQFNNIVRVMREEGSLQLLYVG